MINRKQMKVSLILGVIILFLKIIGVMLFQPSTFKFCLALVNGGLGLLVPLLMLLYFFIYSASCYLLFRVISYGLAVYRHQKKINE